MTAERSHEFNDPRIEPISRSVLLSAAEILCARPKASVEIIHAITARVDQAVTQIETNDVPIDGEELLRIACAQIALRDAQQRAEDSTQ